MCKVELSNLLVMAMRLVVDSMSSRSMAVINQCLRIPQYLADIDHHLVTEEDRAVRLVKCGLSLVQLPDPTTQSHVVCLLQVLTDKFRELRR